jgi:hypothetical protein
MPSEDKKPNGLKPWRNRVKLRQNRKGNTRAHWSAKRWQRYVDERDAKRARPRRVRMLKYRRLELLREAKISAARAARMRALNAKRRESLPAPTDSAPRSRPVGAKAVAPPSPG